MSRSSRLAVRRTVALPVLIATVSGLAGAPTNATAAAPCGTAGVRTISGFVVTCTYSAGGEDSFVVPSGVTRVAVTATAGSGGGTFPGAGATVTNPSLPVTSGATLYPYVGTRGRSPADLSSSPWCAPFATGGLPDGGPAAASSLAAGTCLIGDTVMYVGGGGGSSSLSAAPRASASLTGRASTDSRLLVAGGGGGGAALAFRGGGSAGDASAVGATAGRQEGVNAPPPTAGIGPIDGTDGNGAAGWNNPLPDGAGTTSRGGAGYYPTGPTSTPQGGGGGGGGWFGGGGGGALIGGGSYPGGGGASYLGADPTNSATVSTAALTDAPVVRVSYTSTPPTATISAPATGGTYLVGKTVPTAFSCAAGSATVSSCTDGQGASSPGQLATSTPGAKTYTVTATAADGVTDQDTITYTVVTDTAPPTTTDNVDTAWHKTAVTVTLTANDNASAGVASGVNATTYEILDANGTPGATKTYDPASKPVLQHGESIRYRSTDESGNPEADQTSSKANVDTAAPTTTDDVPAGAIVAPVTVTLTAADTGGSGVDRTTYEIVALGGSAGATQTYDAAHKPVLQVGESIRYRSIDGAGNVETDQSSQGSVIAPTPTPMPTPVPTPTPVPSPTPVPVPVPTPKPVTQTQPVGSRVVLRLELFGPQIWLSKRYVLVRVGCGPVACQMTINGVLRAGGKKRVTLAPRTVRLAAKEMRVLRLPTTRKQRRAIRRILGPRGTDGAARFSLSADDLDTKGAPTVTGQVNVELRLVR